MGIKTRCNQTQHRGCVLTLKTIWKEKEKRQPHCCSGFVPGCTHLELAFPVGLTGVRYFSYASCPKQIQVRRFSGTFLARLACARMNQAIVFTRRKPWTTEWRLPDLDTSHGWMIEEISLVQTLHRCKKYFTPWKRCHFLLSKKELERWDWNMENLKMMDVSRCCTGLNKTYTSTKAKSWQVFVDETGSHTVCIKLSSLKIPNSGHVEMEFWRKNGKKTRG